MWMLRAGKGASAAEKFRSGNIIAIGWAPDMTDWTRYANRAAIIDRLEVIYPDKSLHQRSLAAAQINRFLREIKPTDRVVTYDGKHREFVVGRVSSAPKFSPDLIPDLPCIRIVDWDGVVSRDELSYPTRKALGAINTLFLIRQSAVVEISEKAK
jgi:predicted Mrr-cat superfamily restriction endonuclease